MIILPSHTSHALQPLDVIHFNPFKTTFKKERDGEVNKNYTKLNKINLTTWMDKALNQSLIKQNIKYRFKVYRIWPLNPKAMEHRTKPLDIYTTLKISDNEQGEEDYNLDEKVEGNQ